MTLYGFAAVFFGYLCFAMLIGCVVGRFLKHCSRSDAHIPERTLEDGLAEIAWSFPDHPPYNEQRPAGRPDAA